MIAVIGAALALAVTCVTASTSLCNTPLYTFRIEQASSKMNFLPTAMNEFTSTTEKGYNLTYDTFGEVVWNLSQQDRSRPVLRHVIPARHAG